MPYEGNTAFAAEVASPFKTVAVRANTGLGTGTFLLPAGGGSLQVGSANLGGKANASWQVHYRGGTAPIAPGTYIEVYASINGISMVIDRMVWPTSQPVVREEYHSLVAETLEVYVVTPTAQVSGAECTGAVHASSI